MMPLFLLGMHNKNLLSKNKLNNPKNKDTQIIPRLCVQFDDFDNIDNLFSFLREKNASPQFERFFMNYFRKYKKIQTKYFCSYKDVLWPNFRSFIDNKKRLPLLLQTIRARNRSIFGMFSKFAKIYPELNAKYPYSAVLLECGCENAPLEIKQLFFKALYDSGIKNPNKIPIKIMNESTVKKSIDKTLEILNIVAATTLPYGIWINPNTFYPKVYYKDLYYINNKKTTKTFYAYHEAAHSKKHHSAWWYKALSKQLLIEKNLLRKHPYSNKKIQKIIIKKIEYEADKHAVITLCNTNQRSIVEEYINDSVTPEEHRNNVIESLKQWDSLQKTVKHPQFQRNAIIPAFEKNKSSDIAKHLF